ncbi:MAG: hypothetical protein KDC46_07655 [Thermoleophilia bacterium]|nr:hypothetical protein [Thermoleophilia bacterium]
MAALGACIAVTCGTVAVSLAWNSSSSNPSNTVVAGTVGSPTSLAATPTPSSAQPRCTSVDLNWGAAPLADDRRIEVKTAKSSWSVLAASHGSTTYTDSNNYRNYTVTWRVTPVRAGTSWEGPDAQVTLTCGLGEVLDLTVTNDCSTSELAWTAAVNATEYEVQRKIPPASWSTIATAVTTTSYSDPTVHPAGSRVRYRVRPSDGSSNGRWSSVATIDSWDEFRVVSIVATNGGTANTRDSGDTIQMTFSKPVDTTTMTTTSVVTRRNGNPRGLFLPATSAATGSTEVGQVDTSNNFFGGNATLAGTVAWSAADTVWTWTSTGAGTGPSMSADLAGGWVLGTAASSARCAADSTTPLAATAPTLAGRW